ncbi:hypothetical protein AOR_1_782014 [Paecilomyces variotii No. 5]|uniref:Uncharacterized protein n=1 Tax=Byssochlamys spectabilis (strain No. 5 / NBRC 109023) TaxID=1356009 RepID=V5G130_BYSSN|nr:hypothetical protein AOR_1_782014 [Paecilomyces variotii No. 5]
MSPSGKLMDTEPGGESRQYESIKEFTKTPAKQSGQLPGESENTYSEIKTGLEPGEGKEDYGQSSTGEDGFAGRTADVSGEADKGIVFIVLFFHLFPYTNASFS